MFSQNFKSSSYDYYDYMDAWFCVFFFRPFDHSWFFHWIHWNDKIQTSFPNWFQEWWLYFGIIPTIFCPQIKSSLYYFKEHAKGLILAHCSQTLFFTSRFQISWIFCWDFVQTHLIDPSFPTHLAHEFKVKWWSKFSPSSSQQLPHIKNWIAAKAPSDIQTFSTSFSSLRMNYNSAYSFSCPFFQQDVERTPQTASATCDRSPIPVGFRF